MSCLGAHMSSLQCHTYAPNPFHLVMGDRAIPRPKGVQLWISYPSPPCIPSHDPDCPPHHRCAASHLHDQAVHPRFPPPHHPPLPFTILDPFSIYPPAILTGLDADITSSHSTNHAHTHPFSSLSTPTSYLLSPSLLALRSRPSPRIHRDSPTRQARPILGPTESADAQIFQGSATTTTGANPSAAAAATSAAGTTSSARHAGPRTRRGCVGSTCPSTR